MTSNPFVDPIRDADQFHKNVFLMFDDIVASIREKTLPFAIIDRQGPEGQYGVWTSSTSDHKHLFIFELAGSFCFVQMLVKAHDEKLRKQAAQYKAVCAKLEVDPVIPLMLTYGVFRPRDVERFVGGGNQWLRRNWADHVILLGIPDELRLADPDIYAWNTWISIGSPPGTDSFYCENAEIKLREITDIHDQNEIGALVDDLLSQTSTAIPPGVSAPGQAAGLLVSTSIGRDGPR